MDGGGKFAYHISYFYVREDGASSMGDAAVLLDEPISNIKHVEDVRNDLLDSVRKGISATRLSIIGIFPLVEK